MNRKTTHCNHQFFKIGKLLVRLIKKKEKAQITNIRNERGHNQSSCIQDIKRIGNKQQHANSFDNLDEMSNTLCDRLAKLTKEEI